MERELLREILRIVKSHERVEIVSAPELEAALGGLMRAFGFREGDSWWWSHPSERRTCVSYGSEDGLARILALVPEDPGSPVFACITDDDPPPWLGLRGPASEIVSVLKELPFVEYFFAGLRADWIVFDTHDNDLVSYSLEEMPSHRTIR